MDKAAPRRAVPNWSPPVVTPRVCRVCVGDKEWPGATSRKPLRRLCCPVQVARGGGGRCAGVVAVADQTGAKHG